MKMAEGKRLLRPVERQPMRDWLMDRLDSGDVSGCEWVDRQKGKFHIKWCHGSRHGWSMKDVDMFERWAKHTGRYDENKKDPKKWKANFRCALNSRKDIEEITKKEQLKGSSAYRVYRMDGPVIKDRKRASNLHDNSRVTALKNIKTEKNTQEDKRNEHPATELYSRLNHTIQSDIKLQKLSQLPKFEQILPDFQKLEYGKMHVLPRHGSGFRVEIGQPTTLLEQIPRISRISRSPEVPTMPYQTEINTVPTPTTYPPTPEASEASQQTDDEDMEFLVEVSQEVTVESTDIDDDNTYVITDISANTSSQFQPITAFSNSQWNTQKCPIPPSCSSPQQPFCPLTPP